MFIDPVAGERFFGRNDVLALLEKRVYALKSGYRQNVAITGHRLTGKSSILNHFLLHFKDSEILPIYIEVLDEPFKQFAVKFTGTLLYNFLKYKQRPVLDDMEYLMSECENEIPATVSHIRNILKRIENDDDENAYSDLLNLSSKFKEESKKCCVVILDEFHNLSKLGIKDPFRGFGKKIMTQKDTMYIVASSEVASIKKILSEKLALLFGNFEKITLGGFDCETSRAFIQKKLNSVRMADELCDFIISFADGHPFYLDVLSNKINELMGNLHFRMLTRQMAVRALEELIFDSRGTINQFFTNLLQDPQIEDARATLVALAHGIYRQKDISKWTGYRGRELSKHIELLVEKNLVCQSGNVYMFYDKVLRFWLKNVYHKRRRTLVDSISEKSKAFSRSVEGMIKRFVDESRLGAASRIQKLFDSFGNEIVEINSRKRRLMRFDRTEIIENTGREIVVGHVKSKVCLAFLSKKAIDENDIAEFAAYGAGFKPALQHMIILPLSGIGINAKLMAKELKMWIWDLDAINELLDIYGKQRIVRV